MADSLSIKTVRCMLIPMRDKLMLIPSVMVVEVTALPTMVEATRDPALTWVKNSAWRAQPLTILNLDDLIEYKPDAWDKTSHMCVVKGLYQTEKLEKYGITCYAPPRQITVEAEKIETVKASSVAWLFGEILMEGKVTIIPDLAVLEQLIIDAEN